MLDDDTAFAVVCDGMGGAAAGGIASDIAANAIYERVQLTYRADMEAKSIKTMLISSVTAANTIVYNKSVEDKQCEGMGTTCVTALVHNNVCCIASVGDSRAYLINDSGINQITFDHTMVEYLHSKGLIEEDQMQYHKMKNVITRAVGVEPEVEPDYFEIDVKSGDYLLVCTDGLTNYLSDELIYNTTYKQPIEQAAAALIDAANSRGGKDNITAVLIAV